MYFLMIFIGSISVLLAVTGMKGILEKAFGGVLKMLIGKNHPQNLRALRMLMSWKKRVSLAQPPNCELMYLLDCLCLLFIRAEWEGDWPLYLEAIKI